MTHLVSRLSVVSRILVCLNYLAKAESSTVGNQEPRKDDSQVVLDIKQFMRDTQIGDITIRMLTVNELKTIQGFPKDFELIGTKTNQLKFIGNSVVPLMAQKLIEANYWGIKLSRTKIAI